MWFYSITKERKTTMEAGKKSFVDVRTCNPEQCPYNPTKIDVPTKITKEFEGLREELDIVDTERDMLMKSLGELATRRAGILKRSRQAWNKLYELFPEIKGCQRVCMTNDNDIVYGMDCYDKCVNEEERNIIKKFMKNLIGPEGDISETEE